MLSVPLIQQLKRVNISKDAEKTKTRFEEIWKSASPSDKDKIEELAGVARNTLYRIYNKGSITPKIVVSTSQVLNVSPYYLTGETDEKGESSDEILKEFLAKLGYGELLAQHETEQKVKKPRKKREAKAKQPSASKAPSDEQTSEEDAEMSDLSEPIEEIIIIQEEPCEKIDPASFFDEFDEEDIILLLRSVKIRAKAGVADAIRQAEELKKILLT